MDDFRTFRIAKAKTWDHLIGLVKNSQLRGYGHQIGNLIPCCQDCNSRKGSNDWKKFIVSQGKTEENRKELKARLEKYLKRYAKPIDIDKIKAGMLVDGQGITRREMSRNRMNSCERFGSVGGAYLFWVCSLYQEYTT